MFVVLLIADTEFEFALLGAEHDGLAVHASDHVERGLGFAAQGQLQQVLLDAGFDGLAQFRLDLEEPVGRTETFDPLVGPLVVVVFDPEFDPFTGRLEAVELGPHQELLPDGGPEAFHLAERHRMLRPRFEVRDPVLLEFGLKPAGAPPRSILPAVIRQHLLRWLELPGRDAIHFNYRLRRRTAE